MDVFESPQNLPMVIALIFIVRPDGHGHRPENLRIESGFHQPHPQRRYACDRSVHRLIVCVAYILHHTVEPHHVRPHTDPSLTLDGYRPFHDGCHHKETDNPLHEYTCIIADSSD